MKYGVNETYGTSILIVVVKADPSSKSIFSQPFKEKCISEVVRIGGEIIFHLSKL